MGGIFEHLREAALTMQQGGGIGYDFSTLRPQGRAGEGRRRRRLRPAVLHGCVGRDVPHHHVGRPRRGAMMATLRCDHPDIEAFIEAKREPGRLRMFNLSVLVTDAFMAAVKEDAPWELVFGGTVYQDGAGARAVGHASCASTYAYRRAGRDLHRPHQPPQQPVLLRDDQRHQSLRRAAAAALWRLPAGLDQPGDAGATTRSRPRPRSTWTALDAAGAAWRCACWTT